MNSRISPFWRVLAMTAALGLMAVLAACGAAQSTPSVAATPAAQSAGAASSSGTASVTMTLVAGQNSASYRVREQLARLSFPSDAVGTTKAVSGQVVANADGSIV